MRVKSLFNHLTLPSKCSICGEKNEYWCDETFGCKNGHIIAFKDENMWLQTDTPIIEVHSFDTNARDENA